MPAKSVLIYGRDDINIMERNQREPLIPEHGGYRKLKSFQLAQLVYDVTVRFCERYIERKSRTRDQMVQAARSGVQNIAEGSQASGTSRKTELKLTSVARASLEELRLDYEDFLRQHGSKLWAREDPRRRELVARRCATAEEVALWVRKKAQAGRDGRDGLYGHYGRNGQNEQSPGPNPSIKSIPSMRSIASIKAAYPELSANAALVLIGVAGTLLDRQIASLARTFEKQGGFTERLYRTRRRERNRQ